MTSAPIDLDKGGRRPQIIRTYLGPTTGYKETDAPTYIEYVIGGSGEALPAGFKGGLLIPDWLIIANWYLTASAVGSIVVDVYLNSQEDILAGAIPSAADSICNGNKPRLVGQSAAQGDPTGWDTDNGPSVPLLQINQNDEISFNVDSISGLSLVKIVLQCVRTIGPS